MARAERDAAAESKRVVEEEVATLRRVVNDQKRESQSRQSMLEEKIQELISRGAQPDLSNKLLIIIFCCNFLPYDKRYYLSIEQS